MAMKRTDGVGYVIGVLLKSFAGKGFNVYPQMKRKDEKIGVGIGEEWVK